MKKYHLIFLTVILLFTTSIIIVFFRQFDSQVINNLGNYGSFIGGIIGSIVSLASVFFFVLSLKENDTSTKKDKLISHIFELLKYNREMVNSIVFKMSNDKSGTDYYGSHYFQYIVNELNDVLFSLNSLQNKIKNIDILRISYLIVYYGIKSDNNILFSSLIKYLEKDDINALLIFFANTNGLYYTGSPYNRGHQNNLAHYFRQLFFLIKTIDESELLDESEKYRYAKMLRVQMSDYEQAILFYNSLVPQGFAWSDKKIKYKKKNISLIEKYNLVKNTAMIITPLINPNDIYPEINFEFSNLLSKEPPHA